jgi:hypothetical protein
MAMATLDFTPLIRSSIGFDQPQTIMANPKGEQDAKGSILRTNRPREA